MYYIKFCVYIYNIYGFIYLCIQVCLYYKCAVHLNLQHFQGGEYVCANSNYDYLKIDKCVKFKKHLN